MHTLKRIFIAVAVASGRFMMVFVVAALVVMFLMLTLSSMH